MEQHVQSILQDAGIEVDIATLQNPTRDFMIDLAMEYLKRFHFDSEAIVKPTPDQLDCLSCDDSAEYANIVAINLHAALSAICDKIFLKDLALSDLTSPSGCKKTYKRIQVLFNFLIYVRSKKMENVEFFDELDMQIQLMRDFTNCKDEIPLKVGATIHARELKFERKEQLKNEKVELKLLIDEDQRKSNELKKRVDELSAIKQSCLNEFNDSQIKLRKLSKITSSLECQVVVSPEEYMAQSKEVKKELDEKKNDRQILIDAINSKQKQIEFNEMADKGIKEQNVQGVLGSIIHEIKQTISYLKSTEIQMSTLNQEITFLDSSSNVRNSGKISELSDRILSELGHSERQKQCERDFSKKKLEELRVTLQKLKNEYEHEHKKILAARREYAEQLKSLKDLYQNEIDEEKSLREHISRFPRK